MSPSIEAINPVSCRANEAHAYGSNSYNAKNLEVVADAFPVSRSRRSTSAAPSCRLGPVEGETDDGQWPGNLSWIDVEHEIVRPLFGDSDVPLRN